VEARPRSPAPAPLRRRHLARIPRRRLTVKDAAAQGFQAGAAHYAAHRPGYPREAIDLLCAELGIARGTKVLDLAAGTGISTEALLERGAEVIAVEPVAAMREQLHGRLPDIDLRDGTAEHIPAADHEVDVVTVFQAFHWFDATAALSEIRRVLKPGGGLALVWNVRDRSEPWVAAMAELMEAEVGPLPYERHPDQDNEAYDRWSAVIVEAGGFSPLLHRSFPYHQDADIETIVGRAASTSYVAALPDDRREALLAEIGDLLGRHPDLEGRSRFPFPHVTQVYWCVAKGPEIS
jgi:SAM-dependent methyltransferase